MRQIQYSIAQLLIYMIKWEFEFSNYPLISPKYSAYRHSNWIQPVNMIVTAVNYVNINLSPLDCNSYYMGCGIHIQSSESLG